MAAEVVVTRFGRVYRDGQQPAYPCTLHSDVDALVVQFGALGALDRLDQARAVAIGCAADARGRSQLATARGFDAVADRLWRQLVYLTERYA